MIAMSASRHVYTFEARYLYLVYVNWVNLASDGLSRIISFLFYPSTYSRKFLVNKPLASVWKHYILSCQASASCHSSPVLAYIFALGLPVLLPVKVPVLPVQLNTGLGAAAGGIAALYLLSHIGAPPRAACRLSRSRARISASYPQALQLGDGSQSSAKPPGLVSCEHFFLYIWTLFQELPII
jgi:hypothetical protein